MGVKSFKMRKQKYKIRKKKLKGRMRFKNGKKRKRKCVWLMRERERRIDYKAKA